MFYANSTSCTRFKTALFGLLALGLLCLPVSTAPVHAGSKAGAAAAASGLLIFGGIACNRDPRCSGRSAAPSRGGRAPGGGRVLRGGNSSGPSDAVAMTQQEKMYVQEGLAAQNYYDGAIDGLIGPGTRASIRDYQADIDDAATGYLTGRQINDLVAAAPYFAEMEPDDPRIFEADVAADLDREGVRDLQARLNALDYDAGPVDGAWGGKTRAAVAGYKTDHGLWGEPLPTRRLLARLEGAEFVPVVNVTTDDVFLPGLGVGRAGHQAASDFAEGADGDAIGAVDPSQALNFDISGMRVGISRDAFTETVAEELGADVILDEATAEAFGGDKVMSLAMQATSGAWPETAGGARSEQFVALYDERLPEIGALAIFRTILMPDTVTPELFQEALVPKFIENYGLDGKVSDRLIWIGDAGAKAAAETSAASLQACGALRVASVEAGVPAAEAVWHKGAGPVIDTNSLTSVSRSCGDVLSVEYVANSVRIGLWNSNLILERRAALGGAKKTAEVPEIKF